jgi:signal transduction histidine kinase
MLTRVNLERLCEITVKEMHDSVGLKNQMIFETDGQVGFVRIDEVLISRVLLNLLSNAIKYSRADTQITLKLKRDDSWIVMEVQDHGIGLKPEHLPQLFEPFFRANDLQDVSGTGLGLSIVKDCVDRHNGHIAVSSTPNVGTTFTVKIPFIAG